jgi:hypothetical protein
VSIRVPPHPNPLPNGEELEMKKCRWHTNRRVD